MANFSDIPVQDGGSKFDEDDDDQREEEQAQVIGEMFDDALDIVEQVSYAVIEQVWCPKCRAFLLATHTFTEIITCPTCRTRIPSIVPVPRLAGDLSAEHYETVLGAMLAVAANNEKLIGPLTPEDEAAMTPEQSMFLARCVIRCQREFVQIVAKQAQGLADAELVAATLISPIAEKGNGTPTTGDPHASGSEGIKNNPAD